ncbi:hypothetical protein K7432_003382 [Basidiobolus ranarum]|uniref:Polysaccharide lyase 14 domain-containing protein n=1 Tax=Basidiobolus ranarum TaxID=34480 RepID=A0ABR2WZY6_9FUNG
MFVNFAFPLLLLTLTASHAAANPAEISRFIFQKAWSPKSLNLTDWNFRSGAKSSFDSVSMIKDPFNTNQDTCYNIPFAKQSYGIDGSNNSGVHANFKPLQDHQANRAMISYEVGFPENFNWVKGGKLPGLFGGSADLGCTGGREANGYNCFSTRLMWREGGVGEVYAYIPKSLNRKLCSRSDTTCNSEYGTSIGRNFRFNAGSWNKVDLFVQLNTGNEQNGYLKLYVNGKLQVDLSNLVYRSADDLYADTFEFSSFFGGSTPDYATPVDTNVYIKNIKFQTDPEYLENTLITLDSSSTSSTPLKTIYLLLLSTSIIKIMNFYPTVNI